MTLHVGTSGWAYPQWKPGFYPSGLPQSRFLEHYASSLTACEINATFYRTQTPETFAKWAAQVPEDFRFSLKAHRSFTMRKEIRFDDLRRAHLADSLRAAAPLGPRLGVLFFSFPKFVEPDEDSLRDWLAELPSARSALEFRFEGTSSRIKNVAAESGATICFTDWSGDAPDALPPGPHAYVRLRAPRYTDRQRGAWRDLLEREGQHRDVYAFVKHEEAETGDEWAGIGLARWLARGG